MFNTPIKIDLKIQKRSDFKKILQAKDFQGNIVDLDLYTVLSQVWDKDRSNKYADVIITKLNSSEGLFLWELTDNMTANFADTLFYDILFVEGNGDRYYFFEGRIFADEGYSV